MDLKNPPSRSGSWQCKYPDHEGACFGSYEPGHLVCDHQCLTKPDCEIETKKRTCYTIRREPPKDCDFFTEHMMIKWAKEKR